MEQTDFELKGVLEEQLCRDPRLAGSQIQVAVANGAVTLTGEVMSYAQKQIVAQIVRQMPSVRSVAGDLLVHVTAAHHRSDLELTDLPGWADLIETE